MDSLRCQRDPARKHGDPLTQGEPCSGDRQPLGERSVNLGDGIGGERAFDLELGVELLGPQGVHLAGGEAAAEQRPVCFDEAEDLVHRHAGLGECPHDLDLFEYPVDEFGAVA